MSKGDNFRDTYEDMKKAYSHRLSSIHKGIIHTPHVILHGVEHKSCCKCGSLKPLDKFSVSKDRWDGLCAQCKDCDRENRQRAK